MPLAVGQKVLVIAGKQARVVPDYTVPVAGPAEARPPPAPQDAAGNRDALHRRRSPPCRAGRRTAERGDRALTGQVSQGGPFSSTMLPSGSGT